MVESTRDKATEGMPAEATGILLEVLTALNQARAEPKSLVVLMEAMLKKFEGKKIKTGPNSFLVTKEGPAAVKEAIEFCKK